MTIVDKNKHTSYPKFRDQIVDLYKSGEKNTSEFRLGVEIEHFVVDDNGSTVLYEETERAGVKDILSELAKYYQTKVYSENCDGDIIGLIRDDCSISIEPGAQLEVSIKSAKEISVIEKIYGLFREQVDKILSKHNYHLVEIGYRPDRCALEVPLIPKTRYYCMDAHFNTMDTMGTCMMRGTASTQISVDYSDEQDCINKLKVANILSPIIYFLFDNSPIFEKSNVTDSGVSISGKKIPKRMARGVIWKHTDLDRCGLISGKNYEELANNYLNMPMIYSPKKFENLINEKLAYSIFGDYFYASNTNIEIVGAKTNLTKEEVQHIISMSFFDNRVKNYIEIRTADSLPKDLLFAYVAFIKGLLYDKTSLSSMLDKFKNISLTDIGQAFKDLYNCGWNAKIYNENAFDFINWLCDMAIFGLQSIDASEVSYIKPLKQLIQARKCPADTIEEHFKNDCEISEFKPWSLTLQATQKQVAQINNSGTFEDDKYKYMEVHKNSNAKYCGIRRRVGYIGKFFHTSDTLQFVDIVSTTDKILKAVVENYFTDENYRELFGFNDWESGLINTKSPYQHKFPVARFDIFYDEKTRDFEFCEFNTGGTSGMNESTEMDKTGTTSPVINHIMQDALNSGRHYKIWEKIPVWTSNFIEIYKTIPDSKDNPTFAIVDFLDNCSIEEFECFVTEFKKRGINAFIADIRDLDFDGKNLSCNGKPIDAIYKRVTLDDLNTRHDEEGSKNLINAVRANKVFSIDWFDSQIIHSKQICVILHMQQTNNFLTPAQQRFIKLHQPYSEYMTANSKYNEEYINNKNEYIIKPVSSHSGRGVVAGKDCTPEEWIQNLDKCGNKDFIIQKYAKQFWSDNVMIDHENIDKSCSSKAVDCIVKYSNMEGLYSFMGKFCGIFMRQAPGTINIADTGNLDCPTYFETTEFGISKEQND